jgi:hypothetical protein
MRGDAHAGRDKVTLEIRATGRIWSYGQRASQLYRTMTTPSRGIYRLYTHTDPYFVPPRGEVQGPAPEPKARTGGEEAARARLARGPLARCRTLPARGTPTARRLEAPAPGVDVRADGDLGPDPAVVGVLVRARGHRTAEQPPARRAHRASGPPPP